MADTAARNARLNQLSQDVQAWANQQTAAVNNQIATLKAILQGRGGSQSLANAAVTATSNLVSTEIDAFLTG